MSIRRVGYVIVFVRDMDSMLNFWENIGLRARYSSGEWSEIELDNIVLALHRDEDPVPRDTGIVFVVDDVASVVSSLREKGVDVEEPRDIGVGIEALFRDPEGNVYHLFQPHG